MKGIKSKLLVGTLIAAMIVPAGAATAQTRDLRQDRQEVRDARQDVREANRTVREARQDQNEARRDLRDARQDYRRDQRGYTEPAFRAPFRYHRFTVNSRIDQRYWTSSYRVSNVARWRLPQPGRYQTYVRHYDDLLLVNTRTGRVVRVYASFYR